MDQDAMAKAAELWCVPIKAQLQAEGPGLYVDLWHPDAEDAPGPGAGRGASLKAGGISIETFREACAASGLVIAREDDGHGRMRVALAPRFEEWTPVRKVAPTLAWGPWDGRNPTMIVRWLANERPLGAKPARPCDGCGAPLKEHGAVWTGNDWAKVCAGDYILRDADGHHYPVRPAVFGETYRTTPVGVCVHCGHGIAMHLVEGGCSDCIPSGGGQSRCPGFEDCTGAKPNKHGAGGSRP